jgi:ATP-dependent protease Clp ATPase subunit
LFCDENQRELRKPTAGGSRKILLADAYAYHVPFTIADATTLTDAGHAAKTSEHWS